MHIACVLEESCYDDNGKTQGWVKFPTGGIPREPQLRNEPVQLRRRQYSLDERVSFVFNPEVFITSLFF